MKYLYLLIREEAIPYVESKYQASKTDKALAGNSLGGLFKLYALFHSPETFSRYFAGSPSQWRDKRVLFEHENEFAARNRDLPVRLFMSVGGLEDGSAVSDMKKMAS